MPGGYNPISAAELLWIGGRWYGLVRSSRFTGRVFGRAGEPACRPTDAETVQTGGKVTFTLKEADTKVSST